MRATRLERRRRKKTKRYEIYVIERDSPGLNVVPGLSIFITTRKTLLPETHGATELVRGDRPVTVLRSVDLWIKGCVKSSVLMLRRRACFPSPSARVHAPFHAQIPPA